MSEMSLIWMQALCSQLLGSGNGLVRESGAKALEVLFPCPVFPWWVKGINEQTFNNIIFLTIVCIGIFLDGGDRGTDFYMALGFLFVVVFKLILLVGNVFCSCFEIIVKNVWIFFMMYEYIIWY